MPMSQEHKDALAEGRRQARAIKAYLKALGSRRPGRPVTKESLQTRLARIQKQIESVSDPLEKVSLTQTRLDVEDQLANIGAGESLEEREKGFIAYAQGYSERKGISYTAWREVGVPAAVLRKAGIKETRRR
jgi:seryl-tRNA(Sec) selenium transferase